VRFTSALPRRHRTAMSERYAGSMQNVIESKTHKTGTMEQMPRRIQCEFLEMPGLRLTLAQAERLWNLDALVCESLLSSLIDVQFLGRTVVPQALLCKRQRAERRRSLEPDSTGSRPVMRQRW
jgi:hypothetical protein